MIIQPGTTLTLETGEYSDFTYVGPFLVLRTMDQAELVGTFRERHPPEWVPYLQSTLDNWKKMGWPQRDKGYWKQPDTNMFIAWLTKEGYIEDIENHDSWYLGSYGRFEPQIV